MPEPTINSADDRASHPARVDAARALATFDHNAAYVEMIECQDHPIWQDYLAGADVALAAKAAYPELEAGARPARNAAARHRGSSPSPNAPAATPRTGACACTTSSPTSSRPAPTAGSRPTQPTPISSSRVWRAAPRELCPA